MEDTRNVRQLKGDIADTMQRALLAQGWKVQDVDYRTFNIQVGQTYFTVQVKELI